MFDVLSMGGKLLVRTPDGEQAYRMARRIAAERGVYVEVVYPSGHVAYVYPIAVTA